MKASAAHVDEMGPAEDRHEDVDGYTINFELDGYTVGFETYTADADLAEMFKGLPDSCLSAQPAGPVTGEIHSS